MTISFNTALDNLVDVLAANEPLQDFAQEKWQKRFTVRREFRNRVQVNATELPLIMLTRPSVDKTRLVGARDGKHTVRLYVLFQQDDRAAAQNEVVEVEELIDDALLAPEPDTLGIKMINPASSANDEGIFHPIYAIVMEVEIWHRR